MFANSDSIGFLSGKRSTIPLGNAKLPRRKEKLDRVLGRGATALPYQRGLAISRNSRALSIQLPRRFFRALSLSSLFSFPFPNSDKETCTIASRRESLVVLVVGNGKQEWKRGTKRDAACCLSKRRNSRRKFRKKSGKVGVASAPVGDGFGLSRPDPRAPGCVVACSRINVVGVVIATRRN